MRLFVTYVVWAAAALILAAHIGTAMFPLPSRLSGLHIPAYILVTGIGGICIFLKLNKLIVAVPAGFVLAGLVYLRGVGLTHPVIALGLGLTCCALVFALEYWCLPYDRYVPQVAAKHPLGTIIVPAAGLTPAELDREVRRIREEC